MALTFFKTPKPKSFNYNPRYYDKKREELERKKAIMGVESELSHNEELRLRMSNRWGRGNAEGGRSMLSKTITYLVYGSFIGLSIYFILFTDIIENMLRAFGITN